MASRSLPDGVDRHLAAHHDRAAAEMIGRADALAAEDDAAGREIRPGNDVDEFVDAERGIVDQRDAGVDHFAEIVRRDVGRHADGDAAGAVDQQVRKFRRQNRRLASRNCRSSAGNRRCPCRYRRAPRAPIGQARFGISICRRRIAVDRAEIALPVDQRHAHGEILRHPDHRIVNRLVAVRMIFTDHVTDDARRLDVLLVRRVPLLVHRIQDAAMHRLQAVARIGQRARHDHAHGVIEVGAFHLVEDGYGTNIGGRRRLSGLRIFRVRQRGNPVSFGSESYSVSRAFKTTPNRSARAVFPFVFPETYTGCGGPFCRETPKARPANRPCGGIAGGQDSAPAKSPRRADFRVPAGDAARCDPRG